MMKVAALIYVLALPATVSSAGGPVADRAIDVAHPNAPSSAEASDAIDDVVYPL